jgi:hypothetical protein
MVPFHQNHWLNTFFSIFFWGIFLFFFSYCIQHCFICRPSDSTVPTDAGIEPRTAAIGALAVRRSNHLARSHPHLARSHPHLARSHPHLARSHPHLARSHPHLARSWLNTALEIIQLKSRCFSEVTQGIVFKFEITWISSSHVSSVGKTSLWCRAENRTRACTKPKKKVCMNIKVLLGEHICFFFFPPSKSPCRTPNQRPYTWTKYL